MLGTRNEFAKKKNSIYIYIYSIKRSENRDRGDERDFCRRELKLSSLLYADDLVLFGELEEDLEVMGCLVC